MEPINIFDTFAGNSQFCNLASLEKIKPYKYEGFVNPTFSHKTTMSEQYRLIEEAESNSIAMKASEQSDLDENANHHPSTSQVIPANTNWFGVNDEAFREANGKCFNGIPYSATNEFYTDVPHRALRNVYEESSFPGTYAYIMKKYKDQFTDKDLQSVLSRIEYMLSVLWLAANHPSNPLDRAEGREWLSLLQKRVVAGGGSAYSLKAMELMRAAKELDKTREDELHVSQPVLEDGYMHEGLSDEETDAPQSVVGDDNTDGSVSDGSGSDGSVYDEELVVPQPINDNNLQGGFSGEDQPIDKKTKAVNRKKISGKEAVANDLEDASKPEEGGHVCEGHEHGGDSDGENLVNTPKVSKVKKGKSCGRGKGILYDGKIYMSNDKRPATLRWWMRRCLECIRRGRWCIRIHGNGDRCQRRPAGVACIAKDWQPDVNGRPFLYGRDKSNEPKRTKVVKKYQKAKNTKVTLRYKLAKKN
ncbi:uncharacterized protein LY89DRAFT_741784 [Mollisia scopiformis]|uniref:Uncharacterized protein n=1 Tax=Mollisia scopiformis TaxID=149040 RepID=A0A132B965_MOLSC|nr:uncharacterized protein LY89DRAFT_741784 [Mollisia scopiformis]KUJ08414.1 hypothetical protein LY89DRAFT_741784 [Mollisia scopiformis]